MRTTSRDGRSPEVTPPDGGPASRDLGPDVELARTGDVAAFERIYHALSPSVSSYLRWNGARDVDSLTNQVMAQVHRNLDRFTGDGTNFRSWVFTIAHHRMVDDRRARGRRPAVTESEIDDERVVGNAEDDALAVLSDQRLLELLGGLSPDQRDVLLLRIVADLSLEDVAQTLGKRRGAIKSLQHRALATLRRQLAQPASEP